ncbi:MAG: SDR family oxidoreductase [Vampirovibrionales bacterium]|nr:SDR family oxidoreductase [Vampirovibrionales bacterium]
MTHSSPDSRSILLTGATGKVGSVLTRALSAQGHQIIFTSRREEHIVSLRCQPDCASAIGLIADLEAPNAIPALVAMLSERGIFPDTLINNARRLDHLYTEDGAGPSRAQWLNEYQLDVAVPYELTMALAQATDSRLRRVINIASMYGVVPFNPTLYEDPEKQAPIHYSVAKAAQIHLTKELAIRLAAKGISVNAISYGGIEGRVNSDFLKRYSALCPMGRMLREEEITGAVSFLISDASQGLLGHNLVVDGGWTIW